MAQKNNQSPIEPQGQATSNGVAIELDEKALKNLTGYFDVLIKMDFAQKLRNERRSKEDEKTNKETGTGKNRATL